MGSLAGAEVQLFERLRTMRRGIASDQGVPPYVICHDRTLVEIARARPKTRIELRYVTAWAPLACRPTATASSRPSPGPEDLRGRRASRSRARERALTLHGHGESPDLLALHRASRP